MQISADWLPGFLKRWLLNKKLSEVEHMAALIRDNKHLRKILKDAQPHMRRQVYEQLKPLCKFKVAPYIILIKK